MGCTLTFATKKKKAVYVISPSDSPNEGALCVKGRYGWPYVYSEKRLTTPLIRKQGVLQPVEWDEALELVAGRFIEAKEHFTPLSLAALGSPRLSNEEAYVFNRFVRTVLETPHLDHDGGYTYKALVDGLGSALGYAASTNSVREIRNASVVMLLGADLTETHPVAKNELIMCTSQARQGRVIVVSSLRAKLCCRPGIHLLTRPGTEHVVAYAMLKEIIENGLYNRQARRLLGVGFNDLAASLEEYDLRHAGRITGTDPAAIRRAALEYAQAEKAAIVLTTGMSRQGDTVTLARAAAYLALVTGRLGRESCGIHVFGEKANSQGAIDMGLAPDLLPGFHSLLDERAREKFEAVWGSSLPQGKGLDARTILKQAERKEIRGLYVVGENPLESYPDRSQVERALKSLDILVVQDLFLTSTAEMAHAVLPVASFLEKNGTFTSAERRVQRVRQVSEVPGPKSDLEIFQALTILMGKRPMSYAGPDEVMAEIASLVDVYRGISYDRLATGGIQWPCVHSEDPGSEILYQRGFPVGRPKLASAPLIHERQTEDGILS